MKKRNNLRDTLLGYVLFFLTVAAVVTVVVCLYAYTDEKSGGDVRTVSLVMLLVILFLSAVCTVADIFRRKLMVERPMEQILRATEKIASGDFSVRLQPRHDYGKYDEYDCIMENLNAMASELGKSEVLKSDFVSNVSHEIKTPLAIIQNYASLLQSGNLDAEEREKYAATLLRASKRLTDLVTNILKLNKLENQELKPEYEEIELSEMLAQTLIGYEELFEKKGLALSFSFSEEVRIFSSVSYLEIVWNNLLSNAIKFTDAGGEIRVTLKKTVGGAVVCVSDTGCGISPETGKHIFEKFYQGDTSHVQEGNGLGLALVKKVIGILGGEISVKSELGKGSTFTIVLKDLNHA